jgi:hypothetical protein
MIAVAIVIAFVAGGMTSVGVLLRVGMATEDSSKPLVTEPATRSAMATRYVVGLYVLKPHGVSLADDTADPSIIGQRQLPPATGPRR